MKYPPRLVPFERLMYFLDQPNYPNSLGIRLRLRGRLDRTAAIAAAEVAFARHPGFQVTVDRQRIEFVDRQEPFHNFRWIERRTDDEPYRLEPTDVEQVGGGVFWFVVSPSQSDVALVGNHTLTDGVGGLQVISDWLLEYDRRIGGGAAKLPRLDPERLPDRGRLNLLNRKFLGKLLFQPVALFGASKFLFRRVAPLLPGVETSDRPLADYPCIVTRTLPSDSFARIRSEAAVDGLTDNDMIVTAWFLALARWRQRSMPQHDRDWIRLLVPLSIRTIADRRRTACNRVAFVQIDRQPRGMCDRRGLLTGISRELGVIRRWQLDRTLLLALRIASFVPGQIERMARTARPRATSFVTNLGTAFDRLPLKRTHQGLAVGGMDLTAIEMLTPLLRGMPAALAVAEFQGKWIASLNIDPRFLSLTQANQMLDDLQSSLQDLANG